MNRTALAILTPAGILAFVLIAKLAMMFHGMIANLPH